MLEKLIENWLTNANERAYMLPFCQLLISKGYKLLYVSSHGSQEAGKDIIARNPKGKLEAYQLKCGDIDLTKWRSVFGEIEELIKHPIQHPSTKPSEKYTSFLVTNGLINDVVRTRITEQNTANWKEKTTTKLKYIDKAPLLSDFINYYGKYFPVEPTDYKNFLEIFLSDGKDMFPKEIFTNLINNLLNVDNKHYSKNKAKNLISSSIVITSYCLQPWINSANHIAQIEAWICLIASIEVLTTKYDLNLTYWQQSLSLIETAIEDSFCNLISELKNRNHLVEGEWPSDGIVYAPRTTIILGYICAYALSRRLNNKALDPEIEKEITEICIKFESKLIFFGESSIPLLYSYYWFNECIGRSSIAVPKLAIILAHLVLPDSAPIKAGWPNPYYGYEDSVRLLNSITKPEEYFADQSYSLLSLVEIFTRRNARSFLTENWRIITHKQHIEFVPEEKWQFYLWRSKKGTLTSVFPNRMQSWSAIRKQSFDTNYNNLPTFFVQRPDIGLLFTLVFPHRCTLQFVRMLDLRINPSLSEQYRLSELNEQQNSTIDA